jgi:hypothetical protein
VAEVLVGEEGALAQMKLGTGRTFLAVAQGPESDAVGSFSANVGMNEPAIILRAATLQKMQT